MQRQPQVSAATGQDEYRRLLGLLDQRRFKEAQVRARILLENEETSLLIRAKTHNLLCWTCIEGLKYTTPEAVLHGEEAMRLARDLGEQELFVQAMFNLASAYHQIGSYECSRKIYQTIVKRLSKQPNLLPCGLVLAYQGLAQIDLVQGKPEEALHHLKSARERCYHDDECHFLLADIYRRQAITLLKLNRPAEAAETLGLVDEKAFAGSTRTLWWKTHLSFTRARVEVEQGHWATARPRVMNTLALARELNDLPVLAECTCLLALIEQAEGSRRASRRARRALTYAIQSGRRDVVDDVRERLRHLLAPEL